MSNERVPRAGVGNTDKQRSAFDGKQVVRTLTTSPGVYRMLDAAGEVLYVGKAGNLKKRVGSYFLKPAMQPRIAAMVAQIARIETTLTRTEAEALLLEAQLIKSLKPRYNILLRDDKSYPYIFLSGPERSPTSKQRVSSRAKTNKETDQTVKPGFDPAEYPRMAFHRGAKLKSGEYFGPYPSAYAVRESLDLMQKLFRIRQCDDNFFRNRSRPCLQYQIKRCSAPCVGFIAADDYAQSVRHAAMFLSGRSNAILDELGASMDRASAALKFEDAARLRDQIATLKRLQAQNHVQGASADLDALACCIDGGLACVSVLFFRNGVSLGSRDFFPRLPGEATSGAVLASFIAQYYLDKPVPRELLVSDVPDDATTLAEMLAAQAGRVVEIKSHVRADRAHFIDLARKNAQAALAARLASNQTMRERFEALRDLLDLGEIPRRLECFDISHTMGELTVASCVVFGPEGPEKSLYRRFNIAGIEAGDDYAAMHQALERRYRRLQAGEGMLPDILLIDGGKGQVAQALDVLANLGVSGVLVVGVAKGPGRRAGHESLVRGDTGKVLWPGPESAALHLVQSVRDEAHRFAISGHRQRREKAREHSRLEDIAGVGARRRSALLKHFGGMAGVATAGPEELARVKGVSRELAAKIYATFHG
ncbi:MAG TPA: excinuclease ABC subunit UvrC [Rudaea sp.]|nr:excinuclease ABC subunit UvrC [Rudaea sp.]